MYTEIKHNLNEASVPSKHTIVIYTTVYFTTTHMEHAVGINIFWYDI